MRSIKEMDKRLDEREQEIERLNNNIKKVRKYIKSTSGNFWIATSVKKELLEILDKEGNVDE